jgi:divalent metal cation (Fe/Co/Zn/Cd) transporter
MAASMIRPSVGGRYLQKPNAVNAASRDAGIRITQLALLANLVMAIGKGTGGYVFHSQALLTDGYHSFMDLVADFITLAAVSWVLKPQTTCSSGRRGKLEILASLLMSALLLFGGVRMGWNALNTLYERTFVPAHQLHTFQVYGGAHEIDAPNLHAAWVAAASILVKEWLYHAST